MLFFSVAVVAHFENSLEGHGSMVRCKVLVPVLFGAWLGTFAAYTTVGTFASASVDFVLNFFEKGFLAALSCCGDLIEGFSCAFSSWKIWSVCEIASLYFLARGG